MSGELETWLAQQAQASAEDWRQRLNTDPRFVHGSGTPKPVRLFAAFDQVRCGWCVWSAREGDVLAQFHAGPFATREEAESLLGPAAPPALPEAYRSN